ncbi:MAG: beta-Ala-His dipeptidase [Desulfobacterales bacterium]
MDVTSHRLLEIFEAISAIPRGSKNEGAIARWFLSWAAARGYPAVSDSAGNLRIAVPSSPGCEQAPGVVLQGHLDMVCEKTPESPHDFAHDPIRLIRAGDWMHADRTTLGADNGVALALGAAVAEDASGARPPLELLFTVDEETGLNGAKQLKPGFIQGRILVNLDSETEGVFTVGCAGGRDVTITRTLRRTVVPDGWLVRRLTIGGLRGGHSGIDIHRHRANALKLLARALRTFTAEGPVRVIALSGGTRRNAIPRDAVARLACPAERWKALQDRAAECQALFRREFLAETALEVSFGEEAPSRDRISALSAAEAAAWIHLILALPHGVADLSPDFEGVVLTSNNLAMTAMETERLRVITSQRSMNLSSLNAASESVRAIATLAGGCCETDSEYPPWTPNPASALLTRCRRLYRELYQTEPRVSAIHAGLECAIIGGLCPDMDMISFGPTTENAHSPSERLHLPSFCRLQGFLATLLASVASGEPP